MFRAGNVCAMTTLTDHERQLLLAVIERILPADEVPHVSQDAVLDAALPQLEGEELHTWLRGLNAESFTQFTVDFTEAHPGMRDELLDRVEAENCKVDWHIDPTAYFGRVIDAVGGAYRTLYPA